MFKWRPILRGVYTLEEYDNHYSLKDVVDANEAIDIEDEAKAFYEEEARREAEHNARRR